MANQTRRFPEPPRPQPTGRYLVLFQPDADPSSITSAVEKSTGAKTIDCREIGPTGEAMQNALSQGNAVMIDRFKVAAIAPGEDAGVRMAALQAAGQAEVVRMDGEDVPLPEDRLVEPRRQLDLPGARRVGLPVGGGGSEVRPGIALGDAVVRQPGERSLLAGFIRGADIRDHRRHAQAADALGELPVMAAARAPADLPEAVMGHEADAGRRPTAGFDRLV